MANLSELLMIHCKYHVVLGSLFCLKVSFSCIRTLKFENVTKSKLGLFGGGWFVEGDLETYEGTVFSKIEKLCLMAKLKDPIQH